MALFSTKRRMLLPLATTTAVVAMHGLVGVWLSSMSAPNPIVKQVPIKINFIQDTKPTAIEQVPTLEPTPAPAQPKIQKPVPTSKPESKPKPTKESPKPAKTNPTPPKASVAEKAPPPPPPAPKKVAETPPKPPVTDTPPVPALTKSTTTTINAQPVEHAITVQKAQAAAFAVQNSTQVQNSKTQDTTTQDAKTQAYTATSSDSQVKNQATPQPSSAPATAPTAIAPTAAVSTTKADTGATKGKEDKKATSGGAAKGESDQADKADTAKKSLTLNSAQVNASWDKKPDLSFSADDGFSPRKKTVTATFSFDERGKISGVSITSTGDKSMDREIKRRFASAKLKAQGGSGSASVQLLIN